MSGTNAPSFFFKKGPAPAPSHRTGKVFKAASDRVIIKTETETLEVPLDRLLLNDRPVQPREVAVGQSCEEQNGVWKLVCNPHPQKTSYSPHIGSPPPSLPQQAASNPGPPSFKPGATSPQIGIPAAKAGILPQKAGVPPAKAGILPPKAGVPPAKIGLMGKNNPGLSSAAPLAPAMQPMIMAKPTVGTQYKVLKVEGGLVQVRIGNAQHSIPLVKFGGGALVKAGNLVCTTDGDRWTVAQSAQPVPAPPAQRIPQPRGIQQQGSGVFVIKRLQSNAVVAQEDAFQPVDVPITSIFSPEGQAVSVRQLSVNLNMQLCPNGVFLLMSMPVSQAVPQQLLPSVPSAFLPISALDTILPGLDSPSFQAMKDYAANKYEELYFVRTGSALRSVASYLIQCALFETICTEQEPQSRIAAPICVTFGLSYLGRGKSIKSLDFEDTYHDKISAVEALIQSVLTGQHDLDFFHVAEQLRVCVTVLRPNNTTDNFDKFTFFPPSSTIDSRWQQLAIVGHPPYPVLIQKKLKPILDEQNVEFKLKHYIFKRLKVKLPPIDPVVVQKVKQTQMCVAELKPLTCSTLHFASDILSRFDQLVKEHSLTKYSSSQVAQTLRGVPEAAMKLEAVCQDPQVRQEALTLRQSVESKVWDLVMLPCICGNGFIDILLDCGHGFCRAELDAKVNEIKQSGQLLINKTAGTTLLVCPIDHQPVSLACLETNAPKLVKELLSEAESRLGLLVCSSCKQAKSSKIVLNTSCRHPLCGLCVKHPDCPVCHASLADVMQAVSGWTVACDACFSQFNWNLLSAGSCDMGHVLCPSCCYDAAKTHRCAVAGCVAVSDLVATLLKATAMKTCQICGVPKMFSSLLDMPCPHIICEECGIKQAKQTYEFSCCPMCRMPLSTELAQSLYAKAGLDNAQPCAVCGGYLLEGDGTKLVCGDSMHQRCLYDLAVQCLYHKPLPQRVACYTCGIEVHAEEYMGWFDTRQMQEAPSELAVFFQQNPWTYERSCPKCGPKAGVLEVQRELDTVQSTACGTCGFTYCVLCWESAEDRFHQDGMCKYVVARREIKELEAQKKLAVQCPRCLLVQEKGQNWQHCNFCDDFYFCAECVVDYRVIECHGGKYHREDCPFHNPNELLSGAYCDKCPSCNFAGDACAPPLLLARKGQFAPWEKPATEGAVANP